jgi:hypothetical protein
VGVGSGLTVTLLCARVNGGSMSSATPIARKAHLNAAWCWTIIHLLNLSDVTSI